LSASSPFSSPLPSFFLKVSILNSSPSPSSPSSSPSPSSSSPSSTTSAAAVAFFFASYFSSSSSSSSTSTTAAAAAAFFLLLFLTFLALALSRSREERERCGGASDRSKSTPWIILSAPLSRFPFPGHALLLMTFSSLVDFLYVLSHYGFLFVFLGGLQFKPKTCEIQAHKGDKIKVHYRVNEIRADLFSFFLTGLFVQQKF
jgi:hypothetical protein